MFRYADEGRRGWGSLCPRREAARAFFPVLAQPLCCRDHLHPLGPRSLFGGAGAGQPGNSPVPARCQLRARPALVLHKSSSLLRDTDFIFTEQMRKLMLSKCVAHPGPHAAQRQDRDLDQALTSPQPLYQALTHSPWRGEHDKPPAGIEPCGPSVRAEGCRELWARVGRLAIQGNGPQAPS